MDTYEKKYKELVGKIEKAYLYAQTDSTKAVLEEIRPELIESEDERIRKELLDFCKNRAENYPNDPKYKNISAWIAWLEKQGEQKPAEEYNITGIGSKNAEGKLGEMIKNLKHDNEVLEQKSADEEMKEALRTEYEKGRADVIAEIQKPAWSEEDNRMCKAIIDNIQAICEEGYFVGNIDSDELIKWLKSLKDRYTWKPSDEHYELEEFAKIVRSNLTGISKAVQKLFEAKYLQLTGNKMYGWFKD